jgi:hypothetical protein
MHQLHHSSAGNGSLNCWRLAPVGPAPVVIAFIAKMVNESANETGNGGYYRDYDETFYRPHH